MQAGQTALDPSRLKMLNPVTSALEGFGADCKQAEVKALSLSFQHDECNAVQRRLIPEQRAAGGTWAPSRQPSTRNFPPLLSIAFARLRV